MQQKLPYTYTDVCIEELSVLSKCLQKEKLHKQLWWDSNPRPAACVCLSGHLFLQTLGKHQVLQCFIHNWVKGIRANQLFK